MMQVPKVKVINPDEWSAAFIRKEQARMSMETDIDKVVREQYLKLLAQSLTKKMAGKVTIHASTPITAESKWRFPASVYDTTVPSSLAYDYYTAPATTVEPLLIAAREVMKRFAPTAFMDEHLVCNHDGRTKPKRDCKQHYEEEECLTPPEPTPVSAPSAATPTTTTGKSKRRSPARRTSASAATTRSLTK